MMGLAWGFHKTDAGLRTPFRRAALSLIIPPLLIVTQILANLQGFNRVDLIALGFGALAPLLGAAACVMRALRTERGEREGWFALAFSALLWSGAMLLQFAMAIFGALNGDAMLILLLFVLYGVPVTFVLASPRGDPWSARLIDGLGAIALGVLYYILISNLTMSAERLDRPGILTVSIMFDVQNATIAAFAAIRYAASIRAPERTFFGVLTLFAIAYGLQATIWNHFLLQAPFGSLADPFFALGFLILVPLATLIDLGDAPTQARHRLARVVHVGSPLMLPIILFLLSITLVAYSIGAAIASCVISLLIYGGRTIVVQLHGLRERDHLTELSHVDALTGLSNRRQFDETLKRELARAARQGEPLALLMIDIDHFKSLNDTLGHQTGDKRLKEVASALRSHAARTTDLVARYGGEEFAAILPGANVGAALDQAEKMRKGVEQLDLVSPAPLGRVTVSIGVAWLAPGEAADAAALTRQADHALYASKHAGRNRVTAAQGENVPAE